MVRPSFALLGLAALCGAAYCPGATETTRGPLTVCEYSTTATLFEFKAPVESVDVDSASFSLPGALTARTVAGGSGGNSGTIFYYSSQGSPGARASFIVAGLQLTVNASYTLAVGQDGGTCSRAGCVVLGKSGFSDGRYAGGQGIATGPMYVRVVARSHARRQDQVASGGSASVFLDIDGHTPLIVAAGGGAQGQFSGGNARLPGLSGQNGSGGSTGAGAGGTQSVGGGGGSGLSGGPNGNAGDISGPGHGGDAVPSTSPGSGGLPGGSGGGGLHGGGSGGQATTEGPVSAGGGAGSSYSIVSTFTQTSNTVPVVRITFVTPTGILRRRSTDSSLRHRILIARALERRRLAQTSY